MYIDTCHRVLAHFFSAMAPWPDSDPAFASARACPSGPYREPAGPGAPAGLYFEIQRMPKQNRIKARIWTYKIAFLKCNEILKYNSMVLVVIKTLFSRG